MTTNKKDIQKNVFNDLFNNTINDSLSSPVIKQQQKTEEEKNIKQDSDLKKRSYNLPNDILEDMEKIVYMDRDIKNNTELIIIALKKYFESNYCKKLLEEYNNIKGKKENER